MLTPPKIFKSPWKPWDVIFAVFVTETTINHRRNIDECKGAICFLCLRVFSFLFLSQVLLLDLCVSQAFFQCLWNLVSRPR